MHDDPRESSLLARLVCALAGGLALLIALSALQSWIAPGTVPRARSWTDLWPLLALGSLLPIALSGWLRRASAPAWAMAVIAWALALHVCTELPAYASAWKLYDGPALVPAYLAIGLGAALFVVAGPRSWSQHERCAGLLVFACTANARLYDRTNGPAFALLGAGACVLWIAHGGRRPWRGALGAGLALVAAALVLWLALAAQHGDSPGRGWGLWLRVLLGALIALSLASSLDRAGACRVALALFAGLAACFALLAVGMAETLGVHSVASLLATRLRLFDTHANGIGPVYAIGLSLCAAPLLHGGARGTLTRTLALLGVVSCVLALWRTESAASSLGAGAGLALLVLLRWPLSRGRAAAVWSGALALIGLGLGGLLSPAGAGLRDWLDAKTAGPSALGQRWHLWRMAARLIEQEPLHGAGPGQYYAHARFAPGSFYDDTAQDLHPHNIFLAFAESGGLPAALLFLALVIGGLELLRRRAAQARSEGAPDAWLPAGLCASVAALIACNLLDLGQSQTTLVPLLLWIAIGLGAAQGSPEVSPRAAGTGRALCGLGLLVPLALLPSLGPLALQRARLHAKADGEQAEAATQRWLSLALRVELFSAQAHRMAANRYLKRAPTSGPEMARDALVELKRDAQFAPGRAHGWLRLAWAALELRRHDEAEAALRQHEQLDPRGEENGERAYAFAWVALLRGDLESARNQLLIGLRRPGSAWRRLPREFHGPAVEGRQRVAFVAARDRGRIELVDLCVKLEERAHAMLADNPRVAYRLLGQAVEGLLVQGLGAHALRMMALFEERSGTRTLSYDCNKLRACSLSGDLATAREVHATSAYAQNPYILAPLTQLLVRHGGADELAEARALLDELDALHGRDLFFDAGRLREVTDGELEVALALGDHARARTLFRRSQFDQKNAEQRALSAASFFERSLAAAPAPEELARSLDLALAELALVPAASPALARRRARSTLAAWTGVPGEAHAFFASRLSKHGPTTTMFLDKLLELETDA